MRNLHLTFDYSTYRQKKGEDYAKFCDLSEYMNFKYGIWCSTDHGNKRLDAAFKAQKSAAIGYSKISRMSNPFSIIKAKVIILFLKRRKFLVT